MSKSDIGLRMTIERLQSEMQRMKSRLDSLDSVVSRNGVTLRNPILKAPTADDLNADTLITPKIIIENPDAGDDQTLEASGGSGDETVTFSNNVTVDQGIFGANTVKIGDRTLGETDAKLTLDGILESDIAGGSQFFVLKNDLDTFVLEADRDQNCLTIYKDGGTEKIEIHGTHIYISELAVDDTMYIEGAIIPNTDNSYDLGTSSYRWKNLYLTGNVIANNFNTDDGFASLLRDEGATIDGGVSDTIFYQFDGGDST